MQPYSTSLDIGGNREFGPSFDSNEVYPIRFLVTKENKEYSIQLPSSALDESILHLKKRIQKVINIPIEEQRLIYSGRILKDATILKEYNVKEDYVIHVVAHRNENMSSKNNEKLDKSKELSNNDINIGNLEINVIDSDVILESATRSRIVSRHSRQIQMLSIMLVTVCSLQLIMFCMDIIFIIANPEDAMEEDSLGHPSFNLYFGLYIVQSIFYMVGIYTGYIGLRSVLTLDLKTVRRYYNCLLFVAIGCLLLRFTWAFFLTNYDYDIGGLNRPIESQPEEEPIEETGKEIEDDNIIDSDVVEENEGVGKLGISSIVILTMVIYLSIWGLCVVKARAFKNSVERMQEILRPPRANDSN